MAIAGRVLIIPKGQWSASESYGMLDLVEHNSSCWLAKTASVGVAPSISSSEYWMKMNSPALANALNINETGFALDAKQGKVLKDMIDAESAARVVVETAVTNLTATVNGLMGTSIAEEYDSTATYAVGDYVVYNNDLYKCSTAIETPEVFDITHWTHCFIMEELDDKVTEIVENIVETEVATQFADLSGSVAPAYSASQTYAVGDLVTKDSKLYKCVTAITTAEAWTAAHWTAATMAGETAALNENLNGKADKVNYSVSEVDTGEKWVDGKSIFRRIYRASGVSITSDTVLDATFTAESISSLVELSGNYYSHTLARNGFHAYSGTSDCVFPQIYTNARGGLKLVCRSNTVNEYVVIIRYTKP